MDEFPAEGHRSDTANPADDPPVPLPAIDNIAAYKERYRQRRKQRCYRYLQKAPPWIEAACAIALIVITGMYTHYAGKQVRAMQDQLDQMKRAGEQAKIDNVTAINAQKDIAQQGLSATIDNFHLDQRAWVAEETMSGIPEIDKPFAIIVIVKNTGKTFGTHITDAAIANIVPIGKPPEFWRESKIKRTGTFFIPPNGEKGITLYPIDGSATKKLTQPGLDELKFKTLYVFGRVDYTDIFGCPHWTTFCYFLDPRDNLHSYSACKEHNDADDNRCINKP